MTAAPRSARRRAGSSSRAPRALARSRDGEPPEPPDLSPIYEWLDELDADLRRAPGVSMYEVGSEVVYKQLRLGEPADAALRGATEALPELAEEYLADRSLDFVDLVLREPRAIECGLVWVGAHLPRTAVPWRDQRFYPSILLDQDVASVVKMPQSVDNPAICLVWSLLEAREPDLARAMTQAASPLKAGFGVGAPWPDRQAAAALRMSVRRARPAWEPIASLLLSRARSDQGKVTPAAVNAITRGERLPQAELAERIDSINRPRQKIKPVDLLRHALTWPLRADAVLSHLENEDGWLCLYFAYLERLLDGLYKFARGPGRTVDDLVDRYDEVMKRDLAYPFSRDILEIFQEEYKAKPTLEAASKKRLSRQRSRCLKGAVHAADEDWSELLLDIASAASPEET